MGESTEKVMEVELTSDCQCWDCLTCEVGQVGADEDTKCEECDNLLTRSDTCFGCWDDNEQMFYEALREWRKEVGVDWEWIRISGEGMGWNSRSGYAVSKFDNALKPLTLNGDFRIEAKWEGNSFSARRYSHDEPTGSAKFVFTMIKGEVEEE